MSIENNNGWIIDIIDGFIVDYYYDVKSASLKEH